MFINKIHGGNSLMALQYSLNPARAALVIIWFAFFCVNIALVLYLYLDALIEKDNFSAAISQINASYVTYLGVIVTFYLTTSGKRIIEQPGERMAFIIALIGSLIWNVVIFAFIVPLAFGSGTIEDSVEQIGSIGP